MKSSCAVWRKPKSSVVYVHVLSFCVSVFLLLYWSCLSKGASKFPRLFVLLILLDIMIHSCPACLKNTT